MASEDSDTSSEPATQRRRNSPAAGEDGDHSEIGAAAEDSNLDQMTKKLVRMALACEYQRKPIRRADISEKVLGSAGRRFKEVFQKAQLELRNVFGMEMVELPVREKVTAQQRRGESLLETLKIGTHADECESCFEPVAGQQNLRVLDRGIHPANQLSQSGDSPSSRRAYVRCRGTIHRHLYTSHIPGLPLWWLTPRSQVGTISETARHGRQHARRRLRED